MSGPLAEHQEEFAQAPAAASLEDATWLSDRLLMLVASVVGADPRAADEGPQEPEARATVAGGEIEVEAASVTFDHDGCERRLVICRLADELPKDGALDGKGLTLELEWPDTRLEIEPVELRSATADLRTLVRAHLADLDEDARDQVVEFVVTTVAPDLDPEGAMALGKKLLLIREALRERLPYCAVERDEPQGMCVDALLAVDECSFWLRGWIWDRDARPTRLTAIAPEGGRAELLERAYRYARPDIDSFYAGADEKKEKQRSGIVSFFELDVPSRLPSGWTAELHNAAGNAVEVDGPAVVSDTLVVRDGILDDLAQATQDEEELMRDHAMPALSKIQDQLLDAVEVETIVQYGPPADTPEVSIVVPLYKRIDLLEYQLAQFVHDRELHESDLIYVLDSPELADAVADIGAELYRIYQVPFRVVTLNRNAGFGGATNMGASLARGRLLLLLNSDVLPDRPGWLGMMSRFYDATPNIGALGPKLLYEDDSLQHAGLYFYDVSLQHSDVYFYQDTRSALWENNHYYKGLHRSYPAANVARALPAVTGACLMIDTRLYEEIGGLSNVYVQGGYEDSDLCLRLLGMGRNNWYLPDAELYHLEDQSYPSHVRKLATKYNMWLHTHLWGELIEDIVRNQEEE